MQLVDLTSSRLGKNTPKNPRIPGSHEDSDPWKIPHFEKMELWFIFSFSDNVIFGFHIEFSKV